MQQILNAFLYFRRTRVRIQGLDFLDWEHFRVYLYLSEYKMSHRYRIFQLVFFKGFIAVCHLKRFLEGFINEILNFFHVHFAVAFVRIFIDSNGVVVTENSQINLKVFVFPDFCLPLFENGKQRGQN